MTRKGRSIRILRITTIRKIGEGIIPMTKRRRRQKARKPMILRPLIQREK